MKNKSIMLSWKIWSSAKAAAVWMLNLETGYWSPHHHLCLHIVRAFLVEWFLNQSLNEKILFVWWSKCAELKLWVYLMTFLPGGVIKWNVICGGFHLCRSTSSSSCRKYSTHTHTHPLHSRSHPTIQSHPLRLSLEGRSQFQLSWDRWCFPSFFPLPALTPFFITRFIGSLKFSRSQDCLVSRAVYQLNGPCAALHFQPLMLVSVCIPHDFRNFHESSFLLWLLLFSIVTKCTWLRAYMMLIYGYVESVDITHVPLS